MKIFKKCIFVIVLLISCFLTGCNKEEENKEHNHDYKVVSVAKEPTCT